MISTLQKYIRLLWPYQRPCWWGSWQPDSWLHLQSASHCLWRPHSWAWSCCPGRWQWFPPYHAGTLQRRSRWFQGQFQRPALWTWLFWQSKTVHGWFDSSRGQCRKSLQMIITSRRSFRFTREHYHYYENVIFFYRNIIMQKSWSSSHFFIFLLQSSQTFLYFKVLLSNSSPGFLKVF